MLLPALGLFTLDDKRQPVPVLDMLEWARMYEDQAKRRVAFTDVGKGLTVSTVFLGIDHGFGNGVPILFETMAFDARGDLDSCTRRYGTWAEAEAGHQEIVHELSEVAAQRA